jgi:hypothetical protein
MQHAVALPDKTSKFLLSEPVDWMTFGLSKLDDFLKAEFNKDEKFPNIFVWANYRPKTDQIMIILQAWQLESVKEVVEECTLAINKVRYTAGVDLESGTIDQYSKWSLYSHFFSPTYYDRSKEFNLTLDSKFFIICFGPHAREHDYQISGRLLSNEILLGTDY